MAFFPRQLFLMNHNNFAEVQSFYCFVRCESGALPLPGIIINDDELQRNKEKQGESCVSFQQLSYKHVLI